MWDRPLATSKAVSFREVDVRYNGASGNTDRMVRINDPEQHPPLHRSKHGLVLDAQAMVEVDMFSGMQFSSAGIIRKPVTEFTMRIWFIDHAGFGTAASFKKISSVQRLDKVWNDLRQMRDGHLIRPDPYDVNYPGDMNIIIAKHAFGACDILVDIFVDGIREA